MGTVTPYAGFGLAGEDARTLRLGARWALSPGAALSLEGARRETADGGEDGLMVRGALQW